MSRARTVLLVKHVTFRMGQTVSHHSRKDNLTYDKTADGLEAMEEPVLVQVDLLLYELCEKVHLHSQEECGNLLHLPKLCLPRQVP